MPRLIWLTIPLSLSLSLHVIGRYELGIHEYGDLSNGDDSVGDLWHYSDASGNLRSGELGKIVNIIIQQCNACLCITV